MTSYERAIDVDSRGRAVAQELLPMMHKLCVSDTGYTQDDFATAYLATSILLITFAEFLNMSPPVAAASIMASPYWEFRMSQDRET